ncbi:MAG: type IV pilin N-terminal domain-containing protein [Methanoregula sp.]|nr:type IV pilin N-terminal domain-containing protein [Methanoregula sp.]
MHFQKRLTRKNGDTGVSPVIGVMLMLVIVIIIAAVVSAFAGGTVSGTQKAPSLTAEFHIKNGGTAATSYFSMKVLGVSEPIPTNNLRVITSWTTTNKTPGDDFGKAINGGNTTYAGIGGVSIPDEIAGTSSITVPTGYGNGVQNWANDTYHPEETMWGNFTLTSGTSTFDRPVDYGTGISTGSYWYNSDSHSTDPMEAILGTKWNHLRAGDTVTVRIMAANSGKILVDQNVLVEGP